MMNIRRLKKIAIMHGIAVKWWWTKGKIRRELYKVMRITT